MANKGPNHAGGRAPLELTGRRFGRLLVMEQAPRPIRFGSPPGTYWFCWCDCGQNRIVLGRSLVTGGTQSCGCLRREILIARRGEKRPRQMRVTKLGALVCAPG